MNKQTKQKFENDLKRELIEDRSTYGKVYGRRGGGDMRSLNGFYELLESRRSIDSLSCFPEVAADVLSYYGGNLLVESQPGQVKENMMQEYLSQIERKVLPKIISENKTHCLLFHLNRYENDGEINGLQYDRLGMVEKNIVDLVRHLDKDDISRMVKRSVFCSTKRDEKRKPEEIERNHSIVKNAINYLLNEYAFNSTSGALCWAREFQEEGYLNILKKATIENISKLSVDDIHNSYDLDKDFQHKSKIISEISVNPSIAYKLLSESDEKFLRKIPHMFLTQLDLSAKEYSNRLEIIEKWKE